MDEASSSPRVETRRGFLKKLAATVVGGIVVVVPGLAGLMVFLDPLRRRASTAAAGANPASDFIEVASLDALPADGVPRKFQILANRIDAWNKHPAAVIGAVYLSRTGDAPLKVKAFNVLCPHAKCFVEPSSAQPGSYRCPCHNSMFYADGSTAPGAVSPRGLDELAVDEAGLARGVIRVRFQNFVPGTHEKIPTT